MLNVLVLLLLAVSLVDFFAPRQTVERARAQLINYWVFVETLPVSTEVGLYIRSVRLFLVANTRIFVFFACGVLAILSVANVLKPAFLMAHDSSTFVRQATEGSLAEELLKESLDNQLADEVEVHFPDIITSDINEALSKLRDCEQADQEERCKGLLKNASKLRDRHAALMKRYDEVKTVGSASFAWKYWLFLLAISVVNFLVYFISLLLSIRITLILLRVMERARLASFALLFLDIAIALVLPVAAITTVLTLLSFFTPLELNALSEHEGDIDTHLVWHFASAYFWTQLLGVSSLKTYLVIFYAGDITTDRLGAFAHQAVLVSYWKLHQFFSDVSKIGHPDLWRIPIDDAQRNWAIGLSFAYSFSYILAVSFLVAAKRSPLFRDGVNKILQFLIENPKGPFGAVALVIAAAIYFISQ